MQKYRIIKKGYKDLTIIAFSGKIFKKDVMDAMADFYQSETTSKVIWLLARCDVTALTKDDLDLIALKTVEFANLRTNGKSALVCRDDLTYGLGRMLTTMGNLLDNPIDRRVFRSTAKALAWLRS